jgi:hypothetical protein
MYRTLIVEGGDRKVRYIRAMHESIHVYVDEAGELRTDHEFFFWGHTMLHIHYRIRPKLRAANAS